MVRTLTAAGFTAVAVALLGIQFVSMTVDGGVLPELTPQGACGLVVGAARGEQSGLQQGDVVDMQAQTPAVRLFLTSGSARAGTTFQIPLTRGGRAITSIVRMPDVPPLSFWLPGILAKLIIAVVGSVVLWRGRELAAAFFGISSLAIAVAIYPQPSAILPPGLQAAYASIAPCFADIAALFFYLMIERLAKTFMSPAANVASRIVVFTGLAVAATNDFFSPQAHIATGCANALLMAAHPLGYIAALLVTLVALTIAFFRASGDLRQRLRWIYASTVVGFSGALAYLGALAVNRPIPAYPVTDITATAIPVGYAYAILRHKIIDIGFVLNRAIVFTAMTTVVVIAFALLSGAIERAAVGPGASIALQVAVALALALSFNWLQKRVEWSIDQLFFRSKHRAEAALSTLADEAAFMHSGDILLDRVAAGVRDHIGARSVAIYRVARSEGYERCRMSGDGSVFPAAVPVDDPAFLRLRTYLREVDLADVDSAIAKEGVVFPFAAHGKITGALACAARISDEPYDPDELAAVRGLCLRVAAALEALRARDQAELVRAIAQGSVDASDARARAEALLSDE